MPYLIGTDEAGYGPNLGPLVIAASVWHVPGDPLDCDLYQLLKHAVAQSPGRRSKNWLAIADSKALYKSGHGLCVLERSLLAAIGKLWQHAPTSRGLWAALDPLAEEQFEGQPWHDAHDHSLPLEADATEVAALAEVFTCALEQAGVRLVSVSATAVFPARFNKWVDDYGSKGEALSRATLQLLGRVIEPCQGEPTLVVCDKHGGRGKYQRLIQEQFPDPLIEVVREGLQESVYRWGMKENRVEMRFRAKGESFLPAALSSMTAKYLRELAMHAFNNYWQQQVTGLKPTAGYPVDARRFKQEIAVAQQALGISDRVLWRQR